MRRTVPLLRHDLGPDTWLVVAAAGAADGDPSWLRNLRVTPEVTVEVDGTAPAAVAHELDDAERAATWPAATTWFPGLASAQAGTRRAIPLVRLVADAGGQRGERT